MNWGLPVDEDIGDFVRNENGCHNCPVDGDVLEQCVELHANYDQSPVKMAALTKLGWNEESCLLAYHGNSTGTDYESDYPQESSGPETSTDSTSSLCEGGSMSSAESSDYTEAQNYLCGHGLSIEIVMGPKSALFLEIQNFYYRLNFLKSSKMSWKS